MLPTWALSAFSAQLVSWPRALIGSNYEPVVPAISSEATRVTLWVAKRLFSSTMRCTMDTARATSPAPAKAGLTAKAERAIDQPRAL
jgi:hypothetical protein